MTPQELERLGIAITGSTEWIEPLAKLMGFRQASVVRKWWTGKTKITAPKQRKLYLLSGQPDTPLSPISDRTRFRLTRIMAMREAGYTHTSIGRKLGISRQAVQGFLRNYRLVEPVAELNRLQCPICLVAFQPTMAHQICCSRGCTKKRWYLLNRPPTDRTPKPCAECGGVFQPRDRMEKYCSQRCANTHSARLYRQRLRARVAA